MIGIKGWQRKAIGGKSKRRKNARVAYMKKASAVLIIVYVFFIISFGTWQLFLGNFEAAFGTFPFLLIVYFFVHPQRK